MRARSVATESAAAKQLHAPGTPCAPGVPPDAWVASTQADLGAPSGGTSPEVLRVGPVRAACNLQKGIEGMLGGGDPAALRLALLRVPFGEPAELSAARMARAEHTVERWRVKVAMWADLRPGEPLGEVIDDARAALHAGLQTAHVVSSMHRLETRTDVPSGAKFETFALLDRVLGLDLCQLVGKLLR